MPQCDPNCVPASQAIYDLLLLLLSALGSPDTPQTAQANDIVGSASGSVAIDWKACAFINQGTTNVTVDGATLFPGTSIDFGNVGGSPTNAIAYSVPAGGHLIITEVRDTP